MKFKPSKYQLEIFNTYNTTNKNIVVSAVPGSGKTTTILELLKFTPIYRKTIFVAFNKSIVEELRKKVPKHIKVQTMHSLGMRALYKYYDNNIVLDDSKMFKIAIKLQNFFEIDKQKLFPYIDNLIKITNLYRLRLETDFSAIDEIISYYNVEIIGNESKDAKTLLKAYYQYNRNWRAEGEKFLIDFVDMVYLPAKDDNIYLYKFDEIFIDESQDLNAAQQKIIEKISNAKSRFVAVGDPRQSIYGFMSADVEAYQKFAQKENTIELPLSVCYRCGKNIVNEANKIYNVIESPDWMHDGEVDENGSLDDVNEGDFILCRNVKPLVETYFKLLGREKIAYIKGSEIGKGIVKLIKRYENIPKNTMLQALVNEKGEIYDKLKERGIRKPTNHPTYISFAEKADIIKLFAEKYSTTREIIKKINDIFLNESDGIMLSTIHKSKGLETDNVYLLEPKLIPSKLAVKPHQIEQEYNLLYVAITRAKKKFAYI